MAACGRSRALPAQRLALAATLPAVLARQPDRPDVAGTGVDHCGADPAVAGAATALRIPGALADLPLVWPAAEDRGRAVDPRARSRRPHREARRARRPGGTHCSAAV